MILQLNELLEKTKHKEILPKFKLVKNIIIKYYPVIIILFIAILPIAYFGYTNTESYYNLDKSLPETLESATANNSELEQTEDQIKLNNNLLGLTKLEGQGVEVTLKDDPNATPETVGVFEDISNHIVHYFDVMYIVNELKNAGAEAISVNGQRIVNTTSITCVGNVIKVNDEKVGSPFVIKAIGFPEMLASSLTKGGGYLQYINGYIVTDIKKLDKVEIPKYTGAFQSKYMKTVQ